MEDSHVQLQGNLHRALWKKACLAIANNVRKSPISVVRHLTCFLSLQESSPKEERAVYGILSGDLESVLPMCHSWDDHLWAHLNHKIVNRYVVQ